MSTKPTKETSDEEHFVTIHLSGNGPPQIKSSASLRLYKDYIVGGALTRFLECISQTYYYSDARFAPNCTNNYVQPK